MAKAIWTPKAPDVAVSRSERIVVVGIGTASLTLVRELRKEGFELVQVVARDRFFGGKCVNFGCMPSEFALTLDRYPLEQRAERLESFVTDLRQDAESAFLESGYPLIEALAVGVEGQELVLGDGRRISFDRLVLATGNDYPAPEVLRSRLDAMVDLEAFFRLPRGSRVVIYAESNPSALALGDVACRLGYQPTILLGGSNPFSSLPSYRYYVRELGRRGVRIQESVRLLPPVEDVLPFESRGRAGEVGFDRILVVSKPRPRIPMIDGKSYGLYDLDLTTGSVPVRPDITILGDAGGFYMASEAENHSRQMVKFWKHGRRLDLGTLGAVPLCLHGLQTLAMAGPAWAYYARDWVELDFRALGWSRIHGLEGKLWYLQDPATGRIEAIHICHRDAAELIALGASLMHQPLTNPVWSTSFTHPSASEIFKVLAESAIARMVGQENPVWTQGDSGGHHSFKLQPIHELHPNAGLPEWLSPELFAQAMASAHPREHLLLAFGLWHLRRLADRELPGRFVSGPAGDFAWEGRDRIAVALGSTSEACELRFDRITVTVQE